MADQTLKTVLITSVATCIVCTLLLHARSRWWTSIYGLQPVKEAPSKVSQDEDAELNNEALNNSLHSQTSPRSLLGPTRPSYDANNHQSLKAERLMDILMAELMKKLGFTNMLCDKSMPSAFVIYAHDSKSETGEVMKAESREVRKLLEYFEVANTKIRSDRRPVLPTDSDFDAEESVLENQFCLLPKAATENSVDKVIICYSPVLKSFMDSAEGKSYMSRLKRAYQNAQNTRPESIKSQIDAIVRNSQHQKIWFHHVLTEIAFVDIRSANSVKHSIIPVVFGKASTILADLSFLPTAAYYTKPLEKEYSKFGDSYCTHKLCFDILDRLYKDFRGIRSRLDSLRDLYNNGVRNQNRHQDLSEDLLQLYINQEIDQELQRWRRYEPYLTKRTLSSSEQDENPMAFDVPTTSDEPVDSDATSDSTSVSDSSRPSSPTFPPEDVPPASGRPFTKLQKSALSSLNFAGQDYRMQQIVEAFPETTDWFHHHPVFLQWIHDDSGILGIRGMPGSGKSTLLKKIIEDLRIQENKTHLHLYFFFHGRGSNLECSREGMFRSLLFQLILRLPTVGTPLWEAWEYYDTTQFHNDRSRSWGREAFREIFIGSLLEACQICRIRIFLDGLDEAKDGEAREVMADIRRIRDTVQRKSLSGLSICFTARYFPSIVVDNGLQIRMEENNAEAIARFVKSSLSTLRFISADILDRFENKITQRASGSFLWAVVTVHELIKLENFGGSLQEMEEVIYTAPIDMMSIYDRMLSQVPQRLKSDGARYTAWVRFTARPLAVDEFRYGLACIDTDDSLNDSTRRLGMSQYFVEENGTMLKRIYAATGNLIEGVPVQETDGTSSTVLRFIHFTVVQYFDGLEQDYGANWAGETHNEIGRSCRNCLKLMLRDKGSDTGNPFVKYAARNWFYHAARAARSGVPQSYLLEDIGPHAGQSGADLLEIWADVYGWEYDSVPTLHLIAALFNIQGVAEELRDQTGG